MGVSQSLTLTQSSQNVAANTSTVRILWTSTQTGESHNLYNRTAKYYVSVNGGSEAEYSVSYTLPKNSTKTIVDTTITVNHKTDGTGSIKVRTWMDTDISEGVVEKTQTLTLTTIPRATTPTLSATTAQVGTSITITLNRASTSFTHDLAYSLNDGTYVTMTTGVTTGYTWRVPTSLLSGLPDAASGVVTIRCITKSGSTTIGTKTARLTVTVADTDIPSISSVSVSEGTSGLASRFGAYIQNKSTLKISVTASATSGTSIASIQTTVQGKKYTGAAFTSDVLTQSGTFTITAQATDARGRVSAVYEKDVTVLAYTEPRIGEFDAYRVDANSTPKETGEYVMLKYDFSAPSLNGGNSVTKKIEYKATTASSYTTVQTSSNAISATVQERLTSPTFPTDNSYLFRLTVTDYFGASASREVEVGTEDVILDIKANGRGIAFGKVSERDGVELGWLAYDTEGGAITNGLASNTDTQEDPDATLEHLIATSKNTPVAGYEYYINTYFNQTKTLNSERTQLAIPIQNAAPLGLRRFSGGAWSAWWTVQPVVEAGTSGIWDYIKYLDNTVELWGRYQIANTDCTTALGNMYRTAELTPTAYPFQVDNARVVAHYIGNAMSGTGTADNGAILYPRTGGDSLGPPKYYLLRPSSRSTVAGSIYLYVRGTW